LCAVVCISVFLCVRTFVLLNNIDCDIFSHLWYLSHPNPTQTSIKSKQNNGYDIELKNSQSKIIYFVNTWRESFKAYENMFSMFDSYPNESIKIKI